MSLWEDTTGYRQGDRGKVEPRIWTTDLENENVALRIIVHRHVNYEPDQWLMSCRDVAGFTNHQLKAKDVDAAKHEALHLVYNTLLAIAKLAQDAIVQSEKEDRD